MVTSFSNTAFIRRDPVPHEIQLILFFSDDLFCITARFKLPGATVSPLQGPALHESPPFCATSSCNTAVWLSIACLDSIIWSASGFM